MTKKMLIDAAHPEEVRVAVLDNGKVEDFDFESAARKPLRGNIYLARVTRVEPSLQAAFVEYGGNRHGFLAFSEIHPDYYQIPVSDRRALQEAELEVAELAEQLELSQRGDDDHDDDGDDHDHDHDEDRESQRSARKSDDDSGAVEEDDELKAGESAEADQDDDESTDDPVDEIAGVSADEEDDEDEDEDEEEQAGEEDDQEDVVKDDASGGDAPVKTKVEAEKEVEAGASSAEAEAGAEEFAEDTSGEDDEDEQEITVEASEESSDDKDGDDSGDAEGDEDLAPARIRPNGKEREALFERYKDAKRRRSNLLRNYKIQEVIKRRQILLIQVVKEERGNKGAALTTYMSLAGRYCVLMPNTARGGGISRKIPHSTDRKRLRRVVDSLDVPQGMGLIIRTAGAKRTKVEVKRDYDYLLRLWENIRSLTLKSIAPCLIYEEASLIKRAIRDLYDKDIGEVLVEGETGYREAKDFMKMLMPSHAKFVQPYKGNAPIFLKHGVEQQLDGMYQPTVRLKSGGYIVIHQTEALVAIDVNSGRATRERNIEQTALKTNIEAAYEAARQFRLRDLAGLIVLDFIDMEEMKNNRKVEKALKDAIKHDRARIQLGRISNFGLLEMSRQRRRSGIVDGTTQSCPTCTGAGVIRSAEMAALRILRAVEGEAVSGKAGVLSVHASLDVTVYVLNHHRDWLKRIEDSNGVTIQLIPDTDRTGDDYAIEKSGVPKERAETAQIIQADQTELIELDDAPETVEAESSDTEERGDGDRKKRRRRRRRKDGQRDQSADAQAADEKPDADDESNESGDRAGKEQRADVESRGEEGDDDQTRRRRRRGRRGGRRNRRSRDEQDGNVAKEASSEASESYGQPTTESQDASAAESEAPEGHSQPTDDAAEKVETSNGNGADHDHAAHAAESEPEEAEQATEPETADPADSPQPVIDKPRKKGWWRRGSEA